jgi:hypothetical protein
MPCPEGDLPPLETININKNNGIQVGINFAGIRHKEKINASN